MPEGDVKTLSLDELYTEAENLRREFAALPEGVRNEEDGMRVRSMLGRVDEIDGQITLGELEERRARGQLASTRGARSADPAIRSLGEVIVTPQMIEFALGQDTEGVVGDGFRQNFDGQGSLDEMLTRAVSDWGTSGPPNYDPSGSGYLLPVGQPIAPVPRQARLYLRDLIPKMTTTLAAIPYVQELNPTLYESASAVSEGGTKPQATLSFTGAKADPTVIASTLVLSKQLFEDAAAVVQYINQRLPYLVKFKEDNEFLNGSGTWPDIQGILQTPNVQSQGSVNTDNAQTFGAAFAQIENHDGTPTAVVLNPTNAWTMFAKRAAGGSGTFDAGTPFSALPLTIWGVPSYRTRAIPVGSGLVGDFQLGAMIADREQVNVQTYRERYAELNQILLVCEERVGLMVFRPDLFSNVSGLV
jgi:hypothetical protein